MAPLLALDEVCTFYGDAQILAGVSLTIEAGETVCLLGRNGRGKTTTIKSILGLAPVRSGRITLDGEDITALAHPSDRPPRHRLGAGQPARVPHPHRGAEPRHGPQSRPPPRWGLAVDPRARLRSASPSSTGSRPGPASIFPAGEAQLVAIARALLMHPRLVLLDEPSQGLAPRIVEDIMAVIEEMREERIAILLVEQNSAMALSLAQRAYVIDDGRIVHAASAAALAADAALTHRLLAV